MKRAIKEEQRRETAATTNLRLRLQVQVILLFAQRRIPAAQQRPQAPPWLTKVFHQ